MQLPRVARREGYGILDFVSHVSVLLCLGLYGCTTTAPARAILTLLADPEPQIRLAWTPPTTTVDGAPAAEVVGYRLYYGLASRQYSFLKTLGPQTTYGLAGLVPEQTYYVAVTAYDRIGTESGLSEEITVVVPPRARRMPTLTQEVLRHGQPTRFWVTGARPGEVVSFLFSAIGEGAGPCAAEFGGLCVDIMGPKLFGEATADTLGTATVSRTIPAETLPGHTMAFQAVIQRGPKGEQSVKTNAITARIMD
jgi:hypothetical protein